MTSTKDIIERLHELDDWLAGGIGPWPVVLEAADEIERLRREVLRWQDRADDLERRPRPGTQQINPWRMP